MALSALSLSVTQGVQGRPFQATINGLTTGRVEVLGDGSPGFSTVNGKVMSSRLPYATSTVVLREYEPGVGQGYRDSRIEITAISPARLTALAMASLVSGRSINRVQAVLERQADGSTIYSTFVSDDLGSTVRLEYPGGPVPAAFIRPAIRTAPASTGPARYVSAAGNDAADGSTPATAWATITVAGAWFATAPAGAQLLFRRGDTFTNDGSLYLYQNANGTATNPLKLGAYGTGAHPILRWNGAALGTHLLIQETSYVVLDGLRIDGANSAKQGAFIYNSGARALREKGIYVLNCQFVNMKRDTANATGGDGLVLGGGGSGATATAGYDDFIVSGCIFQSNEGKAVNTYSPGSKTNGPPTNTGLIFENNKASFNAENGVVLGGFSSGWAKWNEVWENGAAGTVGPVGMWLYNCANVTLAFNEAYKNRSANATDGDGLDIDGGCVNCICEYNFTHENEGAGILHWAYNGANASGNIIRNNISWNDATKSNYYGGITIGRGTGNGSGTNTVNGAKIYNNTIVQDQATRHGLTGNATGVNTSSIFNNLVLVTGVGGKPVNIAGTVTGVTLDKNNFWSPAGSYTWGASTYASFAAFAALPAATSSLNADPAISARLPGASTLGGYDPIALRQVFGVAGTSPALVGSGADPVSYGATNNVLDAFALAQAGPPQIGAGRL